MLNHLSRLFFDFIKQVCFLSFLLFVSFISSPFALFSQCGIIEPELIIDNDTTVIEFEIAGLLLNDLSDVAQCIESVNLEFEHSSLGDLEIILLSPSGQSVQLLGPVGSFAPTDNINWNISFINCFVPPNPDPGFSNTWNNNQAWSTFSNYTGSYFPYSGCLSSFNSGPVNGTWTIIIVDHQASDAGELLQFYLSFCDETGIDCMDCEADGGLLENEDLSLCAGNPSLNVNPVLQFENGEPDPTTFGYFYVISNGDNIIEYTIDPNLLNYNAGVYNICGISYVLEDSLLIPDPTSLSFSELVGGLGGTNSLFCGDISANCIEIIIYDVPEQTVVDTVLCNNTALIYYDSIYTVPGQYTQTISTIAGCDSLVLLNIEPLTVEAIIDFPDTITCVNSTVLLNGANSLVGTNVNYQWSTSTGSIVGPTNQVSALVIKPGLYSLIVSSQDCADTANIEVFADEDIAILSSTYSNIGCNQSEVNLGLEIVGSFNEISWSGPNNFTSNIQNPLVSDLGLYSVIVISENGCESSLDIEVIMDTIAVDIQLYVEDKPCPESFGLITAYTNEINAKYNWLGPNGFESQNDSIFPLETGTYTLQFLPENNCLVEIDTVIDILHTSPIVSFDIDSILCNDLFVQPVVIPLEDNYTYSWFGDNDFTSSDMSPKIKNPGKYYVLITNEFGCLKTDSIVVFSDENQPILIANDVTLACGQDSIQLLATSSTPGVAYSWSGPNGFESTEQSPFVYFQGNYIVQVTSPAGCVQLDTVSVLPVDIGFTLDIYAENLGCDVDSVQLVVDGPVNLLYEWNGPDQFSSFEKNPYVHDEGEYIVAATDILTGCTLKFSVQVELVFEANDFMLSATNITCGQDTAFIYFESLGNASELYTWVGPNGFTSSNANTYTLLEGVYSLTVQDVLTGCTRTKDVEVVKEEDTPYFEVEPGIFGCFNSSIFIEIDSFEEGATFQWFGPSGFISVDTLIEVFDFGPYQLFVTGPNGCIDSLNITPEIDDSDPIASFTVENFICTDSFAHINLLASSISSTFEWEGPQSTNFTGDSIEVLNPGWYYVTITGVNTCTSVDSIQIMDLRVYPTSIITADTLKCDPAEATISVETDFGVGFNWLDELNNNYQGNPINVENPGTYFLEVISIDGCITYDTILVEVDTTFVQFEFNTPDTITCLNDTIQLSISPNLVGYTYTWSGPNSFFSNEEFAEIFEAGLYSLEIEDSDNCKRTKELFVYADFNPPSISLTGDTLTCLMNEGQIFLQTMDMDLLFQWEGPNSFSSNAQNPIVNDHGLYTVTAIGQNGCESIAEVAVILNDDLPEFTAQGGSLTCDDGTAIISVESDQTNLDYSWAGPNGFTSTEAEEIVTSTGTYYITVTAENTCQVIDSVIIDDNPIFPSLIFYPVDTLTCDTDSVFAEISLLGGPSSIAWMGPNGFVSSEEKVTINQAGVYTLKLTLLENGCVLDTFLVIEENKIPPIASAFQSGPFFCDNQIIQLSGTGSSTGDSIQYKWSTKDGYILDDKNTIQTRVTGLGEYYFNVKNIKNGCIASDTVIVNLDQIPDIAADLTIVDPTCTAQFGGELLINEVFGPEGPFRFSLDNHFYKTEPSFYNLGEGNYDLFIEDKYGCIHTIPFELFGIQPLLINLGEDLIVDFGDSVNVKAAFNKDIVSIYSLKLLDESGEICDVCFEYEYQAVDDKIFVAIAEDVDGCIAIDTLIVRVNTVDEIFIPNLFSPNGDGINDIIYVQSGKKVNKINRFSIFDRWGNLVFDLTGFSPNNSDFGWNGYNNGKTYAPQVFVYLVEYEVEGGITKYKYGDFTLIK